MFATYTETQRPYITFARHSMEGQRVGRERGHELDVHLSAPSLLMPTGFVDNAHDRRVGDVQSCRIIPAIW